MRAAAAHVLADAAGSVAAIVPAVLILAFGWTLADPITSIVISVLILGGSWRLLRDATNVLREGTPRDAAEPRARPPMGPPGLRSRVGAPVAAARRAPRDREVQDGASGERGRRGR
jgi:hypothetical protein